MYCIHIAYGMKMTLNIDEALLERVMSVTGAKTKTEAIDLALKEMDLKAQLLEVLGRNRRMTATDWKNCVRTRLRSCGASSRRSACDLCPGPVPS